MTVSPLCLNHNPNCTPKKGLIPPTIAGLAGNSRKLGEFFLRHPGHSDHWVSRNRTGRAFLLAKWATQNNCFGFIQLSCIIIMQITPKKGLILKTL